MSDSVTHGWDVVAELSVDALNTFIESLVLVEPFGEDFGGAHLTVTQDAGRTPGIELHPTMAQGCTLTVYLHVDREREGEEADWTVLQVDVSHPVSVFVDDDGMQCIGFDFRGGIDIDNISVTDTGDGDYRPSDRDLELCCIAIQLHLQTVLRYTAVFSAPGAADSDSLSIDAIDVAVVRPQGVALCAQLSEAGLGDAGAFTSLSIPAGNNSIIIFSNRYILAEQIAPWIMQEFGLDGELEDFFDIDGGILRLTSAINLTETVNSSLVDLLEIDTIVVEVGDNAMHITIGAAMEGTGYSGRASISGSITGSLNSDGTLLLTLDIGDPRIDLDLEWWVILIIAAAWILLPALTSVVSIVLPPILYAILTTLKNVVESIHPELPLPDLPITFEGFIIDDMSIPCDMRSVPPSIRSQPEVSLHYSITETGSDSGHASITSLAGGAAEVMRIEFNQSHAVALSAHPRNLQAPLAYQWSIEGVRLTGRGEVPYGSDAIGYEVNGDRCSLSTGIGVAAEFEVKVQCTDARGVRVSDTAMITIPGSTSICSVSGAELLEGPAGIDWTMGENLNAAAAFDNHHIPSDDPRVSESRVAYVSRLRAAMGAGSVIPPR